MLLSKINFSKVYKIEPNIRKNGSGLSEYNLSKMPGSFHHRGVMFDPLINKFKTPFDTKSKTVLTIKDENLRKKEIEAIESLKQEIESFLGKPGILDSTSEYWDEFTIPIDVTSDRKVKVGESNTNILNPAENLLHKLYVAVILGLELFPDTKEKAFSPEFKDSGFYITSEDAILEEDKDTMRKNIKAQAELNKLFDDNNIQRDRAWNIAYHMELNPKATVGDDTLQKDLYDAITRGGLRDKFLSACALTNEELQVATDVRVGIKLDVIKFDRQLGVYRSGAHNFSDTIDKTVKFLLLPENATMLAGLTESILKKKKGRRNLA